MRLSHGLKIIDYFYICTVHPAIIKVFFLLTADAQVRFRTVQRTYTSKDLIRYAATLPD